VPKRICSLDGCDSPHKVGCLCAKHYGAKYRSEHREEARERSRLWREAHPDYVRVEKPPRKCSEEGCDEPHYGRGFCESHYRRDYYARTRETQLASNKAWREKNHESNLEYQRDWYNSHKEYFAEKYLKNREALSERSRRLNAENPGRGTEYSRAWRKANPEKAALKSRAAANRRRAKDGERVNFKDILERDGMVCHICGDEIPTMKDLHFDHVIPLAKGGPHSADNIRPAHALCNMRKGARIL